MKGLFKKTISILLAVLLLISIGVFGFSSNAADKETVRYTALILDTSGSMSGTPAQKQKEAAIKFCEAMLNAEGRNYICIIRLNSSSSLGLGFTDSLNDLENYISRIPASGGTNINQALQVADSQLSAISEQGVIKNVVLCSDGLPESGSTTNDGPYTSSDYSNYRYANAVYNTAESIKSNYNFYTLGFFHSLSGTQLVFGKKFMSDIQNAGYYEVNNPDDLIFTFGEIAENITNHDYPIIVVPGIMGSRLFNSSSVQDESTQVWDPPVKDEEVDLLISELKRYGMGLLSPGLRYNQLYQLYSAGKLSIAASVVFEKLSRLRSMDSTLYLKTVENQTKLNESSREFGPLNTYEAIINKLIENYPNREVYFFSYDWRKSNEDNGNKLYSFIKSLDSKVDIIAHSMGGLVTSSCVVQMKKENEMDLIDKIITCGTPYEGAPAMIYKTITHHILDKESNNLAIWTIGGMTQSVKASYASCAELAPTKRYVAQIPMRKDSWKPFGIGDYDLSYSDYVEECRTIFDDYNSAVEFHQSLLNSDGYNILAGLDNTYFVIGSLTGAKNKTIKSVTLNYNTTYSIDELAYGKGDGTVPIESATIMQQVQSLSKDRYLIGDFDHGGTIQNQNALGFIIDKLNNQGTVYGDKSKAGKKYCVIKIACPVDVEIEMNGEKLSSSSDDISTQASFGRLDYIESENGGKMICVDEGSKDYLVELYGTEDGTLDYSISWFDENDQLIEARYAYNIPVTENMVATTTTSSDEEDTIISIDYNGDGEVDSNVFTKDYAAMPGAHIHKFISTISKPVTCMEKGVRTFACSCGASYTETINALGHVYGSWTIIKEPSCKEAGMEMHVCVNCLDQRESHPLNALGHIDRDGDGYCDREGCGEMMTGGDLCPQCGKVHKGFFQKIVGFFHKIIYRLTHLFEK